MKVLERLIGAAFAVSCAGRFAVWLIDRDMARQAAYREARTLRIPPDNSWATTEKVR